MSCGRFIFFASLATYLEVAIAICGKTVCKTSSNGIKHLITMTLNNTHLDGYVTDSLMVKSEMECQMACLLNPTCFSMNIDVSLPLYNCELLEDNAYALKSNLTARANSTHLTSKSVFCETPDICKNGGTCIPDYTTDEGSCSCTTDYTGKRCEKGNPSQLTLFRYDALEGSKSTEQFREHNPIQTAPQYLSCTTTTRFNTSYSNHLFGLFRPNRTGEYLFKVDCPFKCRLYFSYPMPTDLRIMAAFGSGTHAIESTSESLFLVSSKSYFLMLTSVPLNAVEDHMVMFLKPNAKTFEVIDGSYFVPTY